MTPQFKEECKNSANCNRLGKVFYDTDKEISYDNTLASLEFVEDCYVNGSVLGTVNTKGLTVNTIGKEDLYNKDIDAKIGVKYGDSSEEYINIGKYTVDKPNDQETANLGQYKAYDYLDKLNEDYACNITDWTDITVADIYEDLCEQSGLTPETLEFDNSDIPVTGDIFEEGYKRKDILSDIAELAGSYVDIDKDTNVVKLKRLETNVENTVSGISDIYIDDALNHSIYGMKINGNIEQTTTTGKNLYKPTKTDFSNGGVNVTIEENVITLNGEMTVNLVDINIGANVEIEANQYYKLSYHVLGGTGKISHVHSELNVNGELTWGWLSSRQVAKSSSEAGILDKMIIYCDEKTTFNNYQIVIQVEKVDSEDSLATDYEPYTGGEASPNPDYPQEISVVSDGVKTVQTGKNLFDKNGDFTHGNNNNLTTLQEDGTIKTTANFSNQRSSGQLISVDKNTNYTVSGILVESQSPNNTIIEILNENNTRIHMFEISNSANYNFSFTFNSADNEKIWISLNARDFNLSASVYAIFDKIQIEEGTVSTEYEDYQSNEYTINLNSDELVKLTDDIKDTIEIDKNRNVSLNKRIGKAVLDENTNPTIASKNYPNLFFFSLSALGMNVNSLKAISDYFTFVDDTRITDNASANTYLEYGQFAFRHGTVDRIYFKIADITTETDFKAWLSENNVTVYYELAEPTTTSLAQLTNFKTFEGINHFFLEANISTNFEVTYVQDLQKVIAKQQSEIDEIKAILSSAATSALLLDNYESDLINEIESGVEQ